MKFEEFVSHCSFDFINDEKSDATKVLVIFSEGLMTEYGIDFVNEHPQLARELAANELYELVRREIGNG